jgi:hypothetical protein
MPGYEPISCSIFRTPNMIRPKLLAVKGSDSSYQMPAGTMQFL